MTCPVMYTITCLTLRAMGSHAVSAVTGGFFAQLAAGVRDGITWIFTNSTDFWVRLPSPDLAGEPAIGAMQQWLLPVTAAVAVGGMIAAGPRMVLTRKANPLLDAGTGLAAIAAAGTLGVILPDLLLRAGDAWSSWVLQKSTGGEFTTRMSQLLSLGAAPDAIVVVLGIVAMLLGAVQAALMLFRQAAILILAAVLPMAAAGATAPLTRSWIRKIVSWMLALICYKPAAAAVYAAAFTMIGTGKDLRTTLMGFVMIVLSLVAMPVLMRFFTWTTGTVASGGGGGQLLGMTATGAVAMGAMRGGAGDSGGTSGSEHASYLGSRQSPSVAGPDGASAGAGGSPPGGTPSDAAAGGDQMAGVARGAGPSASSGRTAGAGTPGTAAGGGGGGADAGGATGGAGPAGGEASAAPGAGAAGAGAASGGLAMGGLAAGAGTAGLAGGSGAAGADGGVGVPGGGAGSAAAGAAGPVAAAILAGQALANGARDAAAGAAGEGDRR